MNYYLPRQSNFTTTSNVGFSFVEQSPGNVVFNIKFPENLKVNGAHKALIENAVGKEYVYSHSFDRNGVYNTRYAEKVLSIFALARKSNYVNDEDCKQIKTIMLAAGVPSTSMVKPQPVLATAAQSKPILPKPILNEEDDLEQAIKLSLAEHKQQEERKALQDQEELQTALRQIAEQEAQAKEEADFLRAIEQSNIFEQPPVRDAAPVAVADADEDADFLLAIQLSKLEVQEEQKEPSFVVAAENADEDAEFLLAIQLSKQLYEEKPIESEMPAAEPKIEALPVIPEEPKQVPVEQLAQQLAKQVAEEQDGAKKESEKFEDKDEKALDDQIAPLLASDIVPKQEPILVKKLDLPQPAAAMKRGSPPPPPPPSPRINTPRKPLQTVKSDALQHTVSAPSLLKKTLNKGGGDFLAELKDKAGSRGEFKIVLPEKKPFKDERVEHLEQALNQMTPRQSETQSHTNEETSQDDFDQEWEADLPSSQNVEHKAEPISPMPSLIKASNFKEDRVVLEKPETPAEFSSLLSASLLNQRRNVEGSNSEDDSWV